MGSDILKRRLKKRPRVERWIIWREVLTRYTQTDQVMAHIQNLGRHLACSNDESQHQKKQRFFKNAFVLHRPNRLFRIPLVAKAMAEAELNATKVDARL